MSDERSRSNTPEVGNIARGPQLTRRQVIRTGAAGLAGLALGTTGLDLLAGPVESATSTFKYGKTVWLLMPYTGEFWWKMLVTFLGNDVKADGWNFNFVSAEGSDTTQFDQLTVYAQKADILFIDPTSSVAQNQAVRMAEERYHTPIVVYKDTITGAARVQVQYNDLVAGQALAKEAVQYVQQRYGTTKGKTVLAVNGDPKLSGWKLRADGFSWIKENHPEMKFVEVTGGLTPEKWADASQAAIAGPASDAVAIVSASDGAYLLGTLQTLAKYGKLAYVGEPNHIYVGSIDGKPSTFVWLRRGYIDTVYSQTPDSIAASLWQISKQYILKDSSYQRPPYKMPDVPLPLKVEQPKGTYWGGENLVMTVEKVPDSKTPTGTTPANRVDRTNVNTWTLWGNSIVPLIGEDLSPVPTFNVKGTEPTWSGELVSAYKAWAGKAAQ